MILLKRILTKFLEKLKQKIEYKYKYKYKFINKIISRSKMPKSNYSIDPLTKKLIDYIAKNNKDFDTTKIDKLPDSIKDKIDDSKKENNTLFIKKAFADLEQFHNTLPYSKKFNFSSYDKIYFMYKLRNDPELVVKSGYTKYSFNLFINNDTGGDSVYTLTIVDTETGETGVYEKEVGRFD
jgi:hypothetical protein